MIWEELTIKSLQPHNLSPVHMYGFYKGDMLIVSYDLSRKLNLTVPFPICFGPGDAKLVYLSQVAMV